MGSKVIALYIDNGGEVDFVCRQQDGSYTVKTYGIDGFGAHTSVHYIDRSS